MLSFRVPNSVTWVFYLGIFLAFLSVSISPFSSSSSCTVLFFVGVSFLYYEYISAKMISVKGKAVLITGCDTGFGHDLALRLHKIGFQVFACCLHDESDGAINLKKSSGNSSQLHILKMDVTKDADVELAKKYVHDHLNNNVLWGLVNNAGIALGCGFLESLPLENFEKTSAVNLFGVVRVTKAFLPFIRESKGRIINVSSVLARLPMPLCADYAVTKMGVEAFSHCLRLEMRRFGVKVCLIQPGNFLTSTSIVKRLQLNESPVRYYWNEMEQEAKKDYGIDEVERREKFISFLNTQSYPTTEPCTAAMTDALCRVHPKTLYFVARLRERIATYFIESLPSWLADFFCELFVLLQLSWSRSVN